jgi:hypothetical protein
MQLGFDYKSVRDPMQRHWHMRQFHREWIDTQYVFERQSNSPYENETVLSVENHRVIRIVLCV